MNPTVKDIVKEYLEKNGYGGLVNTNIECWCDKDDLMCLQDDCKAAYKDGNGYSLEKPDVKP